MFCKSTHPLIALFRHSLVAVGLLLFTPLLTLADETQLPAVMTDPSKVYEADFEAELRPADGVVNMTLTIRQPRRLLRRLRIDADPARYMAFAGDGEIRVEDEDVIWEPLKTGGTLSFQLMLDEERPTGGFDSLMTDEWAVFRGDDLFPPAASRAVKGARSKSRLRIAGPPGWSFISAYPRAGSKSDWFEINRSDRKFDRPVGWMAAGDLGVRWEDIEETRVAIAGPRGHGVRRMDMAAFLRWNLPILRDIFPIFPDRLLIVSADDPMWRGGLSGPGSLFIHADRPLISANGTSTLLHELIHLAQPYRARQGEDWIIESMAEYYTLEIMRRSGTISGKRYDQGLEQLESWSSEAEELEAAESTGSRTAKGVAVMHALDSELKEISDGRVNLDDVVRKLSEMGGTVGLAELRDVAEIVTGESVSALPSDSAGR